MIARTWRARVAPGREPDYEDFARDWSLPMFQALPGCLGVWFLGDGRERSVLSFWADDASIKALATNARYREISGRLSDSGILSAIGPVSRQAVAFGDLWRQPPA